MFERASIIVSTYNRPDALRRVVLELDRQSDRGFDVVVADDGSTEETRRTIDEVRRQVGYPLEHAWQEDRGFRAARARNLAVASSEGDYLIFLDGDCVPLHDFVAAHRWLAERGWWVRGNRVYLGERFTARVLEDDIDLAEWPLWRWWLAWVRRGAARATPFLRLRTELFRKRQPRRWQGGKTCNLGVWRDDFFRVDGLDESFVGWGREDSDLVARLINAGVYRKEGRYTSPVVHLWHPHAELSGYSANDARLQQVIEEGIVRPRIGISCHFDGTEETASAG
ncbi:MAG: glycosyltransferase [Gemmatimonadetes bacterium]|uniref:Glycosyltransferase n=1 Tax=Candidatus Kutchimonas denitrificans TaxID=3056748 RepID=A0AAE5CBW8_9BACT|nr:glycosyltransferase [Gemmatimonadota bacterium]NIR74940.1 glycosyltransferase [Candidatus Kutchimonas denitrificans]NIS00052.1 glycosyltransferase [Gemmatimonadota bacterium]NIT65635.1 glycosyltransferase [Gemmatimonadota bacterium]NIU52605.1 glycosyltransferase [Gemmatimonadota bacterium]